MYSILGWDLPVAVEAPFQPRTLGSGLRKQESQPLPDKWAMEKRWETEASSQFSNWWVPSVVQGDGSVNRAAANEHEVETTAADPPAWTSLDIAMGDNVAADEDTDEEEAEARRRRAYLQRKKAMRVRQKRKKLLKKADTRNFSKPPDSAISEAFCKP